MSLLWHVAETGLLMVAAYLGGCVIGYGVRRLHYAIQHRPVRVPTIAVPAIVTAAPQPPVPAPAIEAVPDQTPPPVVAVAPEPQPKKLRPAARLAAVADDVIPDLAVVPELPVIAVAKTPPRSRRKPVKADPKPRALPAPRHGTPDNLRQIRGIGPKIEASLHEMGIFHFDQIAAWTPENIDWVDARLAFKGRVTREAWVEQARTLSGPTA